MIASEQARERETACATKEKKKRGRACVTMCEINVALPHSALHEVHPRGRWETPVSPAARSQQTWGCTVLLCSATTHILKGQYHNCLSSYYSSSAMPSYISEVHLFGGDFCMLRVSDQNGTSPLYIIVDIQHSGQNNTYIEGSKPELPFFFLCNAQLYLLGSPFWRRFLHIEGFQPEWYISTIYHCRHTPFWSETLNIWPLG